MRKIRQNPNDSDYQKRAHAAGVRLQRERDRTHDRHLAEMLRARELRKPGRLHLRGGGVPPAHEAVAAPVSRARVVHVDTELRNGATVEVTAAVQPGACGDMHTLPDFPDVEIVAVRDEDGEDITDSLTDEDVRDFCALILECHAEEAPC